MDKVSIQLSELLRFVVKHGASDLHLSVGRPPTVRLHGRLRSLDAPPLTADDTTRFMKSITSDRHQQELEKLGSTDFGFDFGDDGRFRVSVFRQRGVIGVVLRLIPQKLMGLDEIGLPPIIKEKLATPRGLLLVTGPTGSGKTTTLNAMVEYINTNMDKHIITIEDPIEYVHKHKKGIITQREVGLDVPDFSEAIRRALRQDPDVILVGEMRDLETISAAITAAETGHLVLATLHTTGAARTINRIIDAFPTQQQEQVRIQLSVALLGVISQALLRRIDREGRIAAFEIMFMTPSIANLIRQNQVFRIDSDIKMGAGKGMRILDDNLLDLFRRGIIDYHQMMTYAKDPEELYKLYKQQGG